MSVHTCSVCGAALTGLGLTQWDNRDTGFGLCARCAVWLAVDRGYSREEITRLYGHEGTHFPSLGFDYAPCAPDCTRAPGHAPQRYERTLYSAMGVLREVLYDLETEVLRTQEAIECCPSRRQRAGLESLITSWESQHRALSRFYSEDVYLDRLPTTTGS